MSELSIRLEGCNGEWFTLHGKGAGDKGVFLGPRPEGIYDEPTETIWQSHAYQIGADFGGIKIHKRDVVLGIEVVGDKSGTWKQNDSRWRQAWSYEKDSTLWIETTDSRRYLKLRLSETPTFAPDFDPFTDDYGHIIMTCAAGNPRWYEATDYTHEWVYQGDPKGLLVVENPTDVEVWPKYVCQAHPSKAGTIWVLPDFSFGSDRADALRAVFPNEDLDHRAVPLPPLQPREQLVVDTDEHEEQLTSNIDTEPWMRFEGRCFLFPLPPRTPRTELPVTVAGAEEGMGIQVRIPRPWSRPWGLE
ncbi:hypothetical protein AWN90_11460 [Nocardia terpenica]|uniref:Uncharacterized protein n=1 Tax=Nocardia terpenica TaxID=455432 RepID=A0A164HG05_9NOCA|nr:hypothetical protein AWN90_11460 [Nocardia terpenica]